MMKDISKTLATTIQETSCSPIYAFFLIMEESLPKEKKDELYLLQSKSSEETSR